MRNPQHAIIAPLALLLAPCAAGSLEAQEPVRLRRPTAASKPWIATPTQSPADTVSEPIMIGTGPTAASKPWGAGGGRPREGRPEPLVAGGGPTYTSRPWVKR